MLPCSPKGRKLVSKETLGRACIQTASTYVLTSDKSADEKASRSATVNIVLNIHRNNKAY